jgi:hypothetical protein
MYRSVFQLHSVTKSIKIDFLIKISRLSYAARGMWMDGTNHCLASDFCIRGFSESNWFKNSSTWILDSPISDLM